MTIRLKPIPEKRRRSYRRQRMEAFAAACRDHGLSLTSQRRAILEALLDSVAHPRAEDIFDRVRQTHPNLSLATVHRTLETLCTIGEARKVTTLHQSARYDGNVEPHHHLVCVECHRVVDVEVPEFDDLLAGKRKMGEFKLLGCSVEIQVLCPDCKQTTE